jgi:FRG domain-containing protein
MNDPTIRTLTEFTKLIEDDFGTEDVLCRGQVRKFTLLPSIARERLTDDVLKVEQYMVERLQRLGAPYFQVVPATAWEWIAIAQHYGMPTRLLDWTDNPLTALWFAVNQSPKDTDGGVLWILKPDDDDHPTPAEMTTLNCKRNAVFSPRHVSERITAQVAWFTVHSCGPKDHRFRPLEESVEFRGKLTRVSIPPDRFAHLRFQLSTCGVNHASVFPGLDGLCRHIKWERCYLDDE